MAKVKGNNAVEGISGQVGVLVYKRYRTGMIVSKVPDMSRVKRSKLQKENSHLLKMANRWALHILKDPAKEAYYASIATGGKSAKGMAISEYFRMHKAGEQIRWD